MEDQKQEARDKLQETIEQAIEQAGEILSPEEISEVIRHIFNG